LTLLDDGTAGQLVTLSSGSGAGNIQLAAVTAGDGTINNSLTLISGSGTTTVSGVASGIDALTLQATGATGAVTFENNLTATSLTTAAAELRIESLGRSKPV
jgi:hypothetical protein